MKVLVLGGTVFVGRHLVQVLLACGHEVTLFNRGLENPELFPQARHIIGDRVRDLDLLAGNRFDVIIDTCGYQAQAVAASALALAASGCYLFISSVAVYRDLSGACNNAETAPLQAPLTHGVLTAMTLGALKVGCEHVVREHFGRRALIIRPGLVVGPNDVASRARRDHTGRHIGSLDYDGFSPRFAYWPLRFATGGKVLAPGRPHAPVQFIDVRDLAEWLVGLIETGVTGTYNAVGSTHTMQDLIAACQTIPAATPVEVVWVDDEFLLTQGVLPLIELPFWVPIGASVQALMQMQSAHGCTLTYRPLAETAAAVAAWGSTCPHIALDARTPTLTAGREADLLRLWHQASSKG